MPAKRDYHSAVREAHARETSARIVRAAHSLFVRHGYAAASIAAIARAAEVAAETVYDVFGNKRSLLRAVVRAGITDGRDEPEDFLERDWAKAMLALPTVDERLRAFARHSAETVARLSAVHAVIRAAAAADPELRELHHEIQDYRHAAQRRLLREVLRGTKRDAGASSETFFALTSPEIHHLMCVDRGYTFERYARWLERVVMRTVLV